MPHLAVFKKYARFFATRSGKLDNRSRATHAFELNNVGELKVAQRSLESFRRLVRRGLHQSPRQFHKIPMRYRLFQEMDRAKSSHVFALLRQMNAGQDDRARVLVTCPQVVNKILAKVWDLIDVENEELGLH